MIHSQDYDFSFSGLKTAVLYFVRDQTENPDVMDTVLKLSDEAKQDIAREFEDACVETLISKTKRAVDEFGIQMLTIGGGVAANTRLREKILEQIPLDAENIKFPTRELSTDNAVMIALAGYFKIKKAGYVPPDPATIVAQGNLSL